MKKETNPNIEHLTKSMGEGVGFITKKIEELISAVSGKVEAYYPIVRKQVLLEASLPFIGLIFAIPLLIIISHLILVNKTWSSDLPLPYILIILGIAIFGTAVCSVVSAIAKLPALLNPDYEAVNWIISIGKRILNREE